MINIQQLIVLIPLFNIILPANASSFYHKLMEIAAFDYYETNELLNDMLNLEPTGPVNINFEMLGLESLYFMNNMGTQILFYLSYFIVAALVLFLMLIARYNQLL